MAEIKLCKGCTYCNYDHSMLSHICTVHYKPDTVTGDLTGDYRLCALIRATGFDCGPEAKLFKKKVPFWEFWRKNEQV